MLTCSNSQAVIQIRISRVSLASSFTAERTSLEYEYARKRINFSQRDEFLFQCSLPSRRDIAKYRLSPRPPDMSPFYRLAQFSGFESLIESVLYAVGDLSIIVFRVGEIL